jgi:hypothetical protein
MKQIKPTIEESASEDADSSMVVLPDWLSVYHKTPHFAVLRKAGKAMKRKPAWLLLKARPVCHR